jgi:hypothetical protein
MPSAQERLPGWPADVAEALEREAKLAEELATMSKEGKFRPTPQDEKLLQVLVADSNKAFRELRNQDYIRCVLAEESLVRRYKPANP